MWEGRGRSRLSSSSSLQPLSPLRSAYTDVRDATLSAQRAGQISHREAAGVGRVQGVVYRQSGDPPLL